MIGGGGVVWHGNRQSGETYEGGSILARDSRNSKTYWVGKVIKLPSTNFFQPSGMNAGAAPWEAAVAAPHRPRRRRAPPHEGMKGRRGTDPTPHKFVTQYSK